MSVVDTFNRADSASTLGTTSDGSQTWTALAGTWGISSNTAYSPTLGTSPAISVASVPCGSADGVLGLTLTTVTAGNVALAFRILDGQNLWVVNTFRLQKITAGGFTNVVDYSGTPLVSGDVIGVTLTGTGITVKRNGSVLATATDSYLSTRTTHGLFANSTDSRSDGFSYTSPTAAAAPARPVHARRSQALMRAAVI